MTFKLNIFNNFQDFLINFKLTLNEFYKSNKTLLKDF